MPSTNSLSIVIVNWNTKELIRDCLKSIKKNLTEQLYKVYMVDNASSDKSVQMIKKYFRWVNLIENKENLGFARANNQVLKKIKSEFVLILNPDTIIRPKSIEKMVEYLIKDKKTAAVGPGLLNKDGTVQHLGLYRKPPTLMQAIFFYTDLYRISIKVPLLVHKFWEEDVESNEAIEVDQIPGACILGRIVYLRRTGFFDESYPFWFEDVDLCFKLRKLGFKLMYIPTAKIVHIVGGATDKWTDRAKKEARFFKSLFIFFDKNKPSWQSILIRVIIVSSQLFMLVSRTIMQTFKPNQKRLSFIKLKLFILKNLFTNQPLPTI